MRILGSDRSEAREGTCEQCGAKTLVRRVQSVGFGKESRGHFKLCFDCFGPRVRFIGRDGKEYEAPLRDILHTCDCGAIFDSERGLRTHRRSCKFDSTE